MTKLRIVFSLVRYLWGRKHVRGVKATINTMPNGQTWFLVEPATILISPSEEGWPVAYVDEKAYVLVGGGKHKGSYLLLGDVKTFANDSCPVDDHDRQESLVG